MKDGYLSYCKNCTTARVRKDRRLNPNARLRDKVRSIQEHRKKLNAETCRKNRQENPEKYKAQSALGNAVRDRLIIRPSICTTCNQEKKLVGHHEDYSKPLDVIWMCHLCHARHHHAKD